MNELEEVEGISEKISKKQGLQSSNKMTSSEGSSIEQSKCLHKMSLHELLLQSGS